MKIDIPMAIPEGEHEWFRRTVEAMSADMPYPITDIASAIAHNWHLYKPMSDEQ